jgi:hypothetical protein
MLDVNHQNLLHGANLPGFDGFPSRGSRAFNERRRAREGWCSNPLDELNRNRQDAFCMFMPFA